MLLKVISHQPPLHWRVCVVLATQRVNICLHTLGLGTQQKRNVTYIIIRGKDRDNNKKISNNHRVNCQEGNRDFSSKLLEVNKRLLDKLVSMFMTKRITS